MFDLGLFGIEISKALLLQVGLNAAGYLAAGGLSLVLFSSIIKRHLKKMLPEVVAQSAEIVSINNEHTRSVPPMSESTKEMQPTALASEPVAGFVSFDSVGGNRIAASPMVVNNRESVENAVTQYRETENSVAGSGANGSYTRNRADVIRLAKEMLTAGQSSERVRGELPISDSELRLVELGVRR